MFKQSKKRAFTLLEVLIAFLLIILCLVPLLAPYPYMYKEQKKIIDELKVDRLASLYYVDLLARIIKKEIDPSKFGKGEMQPVETKEKSPYTAFYLFNEPEVTINFQNSKGQIEFSFLYVMPVSKEIQIIEKANTK